MPYLRSRRFIALLTLPRDGRRADTLCTVRSGDNAYSSTPFRACAGSLPIGKAAMAFASATPQKILWDRKRRCSCDGSRPKRTSRALEITGHLDARDPGRGAGVVPCPPGMQS